jgi:hypothetical protein
VPYLHPHLLSGTYTKLAPQRRTLPLPKAALTQELGGH